MLSIFPPLKTSLFFLSVLCVLCGSIFSQWYTYPTYQEYVGYMEKWQEDYPQLAKLNGPLLLSLPRFALSFMKVLVFDLVHLPQRVRWTRIGDLIR